MEYIDIKELIAGHQQKDDLYRAIVNAPFKDRVAATNLGLGIVVLLLVNQKTKTLDRIALSDTDLAQGAVKMSPKPFKEITIPLDYADNILVTAIETSAPQQTSDWRYMFAPTLTPQEARFNQAGAGIDCSVVYPLVSGDKPPIGAMIFSYFEPISSIGEVHHAFMKSYSAMVSDALAGPN